MTQTLACTLEHTYEIKFGYILALSQASIHYSLHTCIIIIRESMHHISELHMNLNTFYKTIGLYNHNMQAIGTTVMCNNNIIAS